jgi:hypothetical protein
MFHLFIARPNRQQNTLRPRAVHGSKQAQDLLAGGIAKGAAAR